MGVPTAALRRPARAAFGTRVSAANALLARGKTAEAAGLIKAIRFENGKLRMGEGGAAIVDTKGLTDPIEVILAQFRSGLVKEAKGSLGAYEAVYKYKEKEFSRDATSQVMSWSHWAVALAVTGRDR